MSLSLPLFSHVLRLRVVLTIKPPSSSHALHNDVSSLCEYVVRRRGKKIVHMDGRPGHTIVVIGEGVVRVVSGQWVCVEVRMTMALFGQRDDLSLDRGRWMPKFASHLIWGYLLFIPTV